MRMICEDCGAVRTDEEREFYGSRCEGCERDAWNALQRWKAGAADPVFDAMYPDIKPVVH